MPVDGTFVLPIAAGRNVGVSTACLDGFDQLITVVAFVGSNCGGLDSVDQGGPLSHIGDLSSGQNQAKRIAQSIDAGVDLGGQPAS